MPDISEERLAELEAMEWVVKHVILPQSRHAAKEMAREQCEKYPNHLTDEEVKDLMYGHAMWDDPPKSWTKKKLVTWSQGYLYGREIVGRNVGQYFERFVRALHTPAQFARRQRLSLLEMVDGVECDRDDCKGHYKVDKERIILECTNCHTVFTYELVIKLMRKQGW